MINHRALGANTTGSRTRVSTLVLYASFVAGTFGTDHTFWTATWRTSYKVRQARAYGLTVQLFALAIRSTW